MGKSTESPPSEWKLHWLLLLAATIGVSFGSIPTVTLGLFMEPLQNEFGWSRTTISLGMTVFAALSVPLTPFGGALVDRFGSRRIAIPGLALCGVAFAAFGLMTDAVAQWIVTWVIFSAVSILIRTMVWNPAVSRAFVANRGLAMAVLLSGMSLAGSTAPLLAHELIETFGWRGAYFSLGLGWTGAALVLVFLFFRERAIPAPADNSGATAARTLLPGGLTTREALRSVRIIRIALAALLATTLSSAYGVHMVPIYTSLGMQRGEAASVALLAGVAGVLSKLAIGWLADRVQTGFLPFAALALPGGGYALLLASQGSTPMMLAGAVLIGLGGGATLHMIMYLTTQYGGLRNFGKIYGSVSALVALAAGIGPVSAGAIFDQTQSYALYLTIGIPMFLAAGLLVFGLGPYPHFPPVDPGDSDAHAKST